MSDRHRYPREELEIMRAALEEVERINPVLAKRLRDTVESAALGYGEDHGIIMYVNAYGETSDFVGGSVSRQDRHKGDFKDSDLENVARIRLKS